MNNEKLNKNEKVLIKSNIFKMKELNKKFCITYD